MRAVFETLGIGDVVAKSLGSRNPHNMVKATFDALQHVRQPALGGHAAAARRCPSCSAGATRRRPAAPAGAGRC